MAKHSTGLDEIFVEIERARTWPRPMVSRTLPNLEWAEETVRRDRFEVVLCRPTEFNRSTPGWALYELAAMTRRHWYSVQVAGDLARARRVAKELVRPSDRTHGLRLSVSQRSIYVTLEQYRMSGQARFVTTSLKVGWAPKGSAFEKDAMYSFLLDARHPERVTDADLEANRERSTALVPLLAQKMADAEELIRHLEEGADAEMDDCEAPGPR